MARSSKMIEVNAQPEKYWQVVFISLAPLIIPILLFVYGRIYADLGVPIGTFVLPFWPLFLVVMLPYYAASIVIIDANEFYLVYVFEVPTIEGRRGVKYIPALLARYERYLRTIQKALFPGAPEEISHLPDDKAELARSTLLKPLRVTTGGPETGVYAAELKDNILNDQLTVELILAVFWMPELILRPGTGEEGLFEFSINIPGKTQAEKITAINSQLRISGEKAMREIMGKHSAGWAIAYLDLLNGYVRARIAESVVQWGIIITDVSVEGVGGSHDVNIALGAIPAAKARSQAAGIEAAGEKDRLITVSEGEAQAKVNIGKAKGEAYRLKAEGMGMTPREILDRKLAPKVFGNKTVIVGGEDGVSKMMGLAMATLRAKVGDKE